MIGDGDDAILTGSVFLSNTEDSGIEFHGGSAYIRSVGYNGFDRTGSIWNYARNSQMGRTRYGHSCMAPYV